MTQRELADLVLTPVHDDIDHSLDEPWAERIDDCNYQSRFSGSRFGDTLTVIDRATGQRFIIAVAEVQP